MELPFVVRAQHRAICARLQGVAWPCVQDAGRVQVVNFSADTLLG
jgi:hypothetical protein